MNNQRLLSLDVFRGITIAGMILVNNPGSWSTVYAPLLHADWHGSTPTDWVFPFFLFIMGVAVPLALGRRVAQGHAPRQLMAKVFTRTLIIFGLGLFLAAFPYFGWRDPQPAGLKIAHYTLLTLAMFAVFGRGILQQKRFQEEKYVRRRKLLGYIALGIIAIMIALGFSYYDLSSLRIPGVLQRIALVYFFCSLIYLYVPSKIQYGLTAALLLLYWGLMTLVPVPGYGVASLEPEANLGAWFDRLLLGTEHLWSQSRTWDPEGLLSTLPAIGTGMLGIFAGNWLRADTSAYRKVNGLLVAGVLLIVLGQVWGMAFPINKKIWTSSYVLYTGGLAFLFLGICYYLNDVLQWNTWSKPFAIFGVNALFVYVLSGLVAKLFYMIQLPQAGGDSISLQSWLYQSVYLPVFSGKAASLAWALSFVLLMFIPCWILFRKRIFIKV